MAMLHMQPARTFPFLPLLLLGSACETARQDVRDPLYEAHGSEPFWGLAIGEDRIVLNATLDEIGEMTWPRTLPRTVGGVRTWQSGEGARAVSIESRRGPCTNEAHEIYEDEVVVRVGGLELSGCGGRLIGREDD